MKQTLSLGLAGILATLGACNTNQDASQNSRLVDFKVEQGLMVDGRSYDLLVTALTELDRPYESVSLGEITEDGFNAYFSCRNPGGDLSGDSSHIRIWYGPGFEHFSPATCQKIAQAAYNAREQGNIMPF